MPAFQSADYSGAFGKTLNAPPAKSKIRIYGDTKLERVSITKE